MPFSISVLLFEFVLYALFAPFHQLVGECVVQLRLAFLLLF